MLLALALVALALRVLVPTGYMLAAPHGLTSIIICSGSGPLAISSDLARPGAPSDPSPARGKAHDAPCAFAAAAHLAAPVESFVVTPRFVESDAPSVIRISREAAQLAAPPPWSTGPPLRG